MPPRDINDLDETNTRRARSGRVAIPVPPIVAVMAAAEPVVEAPVVPEPTAPPLTLSHTEDELDKEAANKKWLWFGLTLDTPFHLKVERLHGDFGFTAEEIANEFESPDVDADKVQPIIERLHKKWEEAGEDLTDDQRQKMRGKQITDLEALALQIDRAYATSRDSKMLSAKLSIRNKIAELRDLEGKRVAAEAEEIRSRDALERGIALLEPDEIKELLERCETALAQEGVAH